VYIGYDNEQKNTHVLFNNEKYGGKSCMHIKYIRKSDGHRVGTCA